MGVAELRRLKQLEEENRKLKQLVADLSLDKSMPSPYGKSRLKGECYDTAELHSAYCSGGLHDGDVHHWMALSERKLERS